MQPVNFDEVLENIVATDKRYPRQAYVFLREALDHTQKAQTRQRKGGKEAPATRHVSGRELLEGIRAFALQQFGPMAVTVLNEWGIHRCEDFGELVFNMVDHRLLGKTDQDSREDFKGAYEFDDAFLKPFRPAGKMEKAESGKQKAETNPKAE